MNEQKLLIATANPGKVAEFRKLLAGLPIRVIGPEDLTQDVPDCIEQGSSFCENARIKARHWFNHSGLASLADDSGLAVEALEGAPGIYSARFAGDGATDKNNLEHLLDAFTELISQKGEPRLSAVWPFAAPTAAWSFSRTAAME